MDQTLTRGTIWLALALYVAGAGVLGLSRGSASRLLARWLHTLGCAAFLGHVVCAFEFYHHWSHAAAELDTARQTAEFTGWNWGGGLYVNYAFGLLWMGDVAWSWASPGTYWRRPPWMTWSVRLVFLFMIVNGAVVFVRGPRSWIGLLLCLAVLASWWKGRKPGVDTPGQSGEAWTR